MTLQEFRRMWANCQMVELDRRQAHGATWILYNVTEPASTSDYGRHYGMYVVLNPAGQIVGHNMHNTSDNGGNWLQQVTGWWERHIKQGLVAPGGKPIPLEV